LAIRIAAGLHIQPIIQYRSTFELTEFTRVHRNFIPNSRTKMRSETTNRRWGIVSGATLWATHGFIQMRAFESIKFTAFPKSARNPHYSFSVLMAVLLIMALLLLE